MGQEGRLITSAARPLYAGAQRRKLPVRYLWLRPGLSILSATCRNLDRAERRQPGWSSVAGCLCGPRTRLPGNPKSRKRCEVTPPVREETKSGSHVVPSLAAARGPGRRLDRSPTRASAGTPAEFGTECDRGGCRGFHWPSMPKPVSSGKALVWLKSQVRPRSGPYPCRRTTRYRDNSRIPKRWRMSDVGMLGVGVQSRRCRASHPGLNLRRRNRLAVHRFLLFPWRSYRST